jgi:hypothetical protein
VPESDTSTVWGWTATAVILGWRELELPGLGSPLPHLHRDWAHPAHIFTGTGPHRCHICAGTGPTPPSSAPNGHWLLSYENGRVCAWPLPHTAAARWHAYDACRPARIAYGRCAAHMGTRSTHTGALSSAGEACRPCAARSAYRRCAAQVIRVALVRLQPPSCAARAHRPSAAQNAPIGVVPWTSRTRACTATPGH